MSDAPSPSPSLREDTILGIVTQALWDIENTSRLSEHPEMVETYRHKARELIEWITRLGGQITLSAAPSPPLQGLPGAKPSDGEKP